MTNDQLIMKKSSNFISLVVAVVFFYMICSCGSGAGVNDPGTEYMPDMGHSVAYEANYYCLLYTSDAADE